MNKSRNEILQEEFSKFRREYVVGSITPDRFPPFYEKPVFAAMWVFAMQEARSFANWLSNQVIAGRTMDKLWEDYQEQTS